MNKILRYFGFYNVKNPLEIFPLINLVEDYDVNFRKITILMFSMLPLTILERFLTTLLFGKDFLEIPIMIIVCVLTIIYILYLLQVDVVFEKVNKFLKKGFKKRAKKIFNIDLKNPEFKKFINKYYFYIQEKNLSEKEIINIINNWKEFKKKYEKNNNKRNELYAELNKISKREGKI